MNTALRARILSVVLLLYAVILGAVLSRDLFLAFSPPPLVTSSQIPTISFDTLAVAQEKLSTRVPVLAGTIPTVASVSSFGKAEPFGK